MSKYIRKSSPSKDPMYHGQQRFEHWYADNQVYFITARCKDRFPAFASENAKVVFWDRLGHYTQEASFTPWIVSLIPNHYHLLGYCRYGEKLPRMMQRLHGSVAKLVNDTLAEPLKPFWWDRGHQTYFDGCIRDELQCRRAFRYTQRQSVRHGLCKRWENYPHTRIWVELERGIKRSHELGAFLEKVPYRRYEKKRQ